MSKTNNNTNTAAANVITNTNDLRQKIADIRSQLNFDIIASEGDKSELAKSMRKTAKLRLHNLACIRDIACDVLSYDGCFGKNSPKLGDFIDFDVNKALKYEDGLTIDNSMLAILNANNDTIQDIIKMINTNDILDSFAKGILPQYITQKGGINTENTAFSKAVKNAAKSISEHLEIKACPNNADIKVLAVALTKIKIKLSDSIYNVSATKVSNILNAIQAVFSAKILNIELKKSEPKTSKEENSKSVVEQGKEDLTKSTAIPETAEETVAA